MCPQGAQGVQGAQGSSSTLNNIVQYNGDTTELINTPGTQLESEFYTVGFAGNAPRSNFISETSGTIRPTQTVYWRAPRTGTLRNLFVSMASFDPNSGVQQLGTNVAPVNLNVQFYLGTPALMNTVIQFEATALNTTLSFPGIALQFGEDITNTVEVQAGQLVALVISSVDPPRVVDKFLTIFAGVEFN